MNYEQVIIYFFSGTGNAKRAASWIKDGAQEKKISAQFIKIEKGKSYDYPDLNKKTLVGLCSPTHGFNMPPLVLKFLRRFPKTNNADVFILNTRAGMKISKLFLPGLSGLAQIFPAIILKLKGYKIVGMQPLDLPSNWILLHPGLRSKVVDSIFTRCKKIVDQFASDLFSGKHRYKALLSLPIDLLVTPIALSYYFLGRFFLAKTLIATNACDGCNICINTCPVKAIKTVDGRPFWTFKCESCMHCINVCPQRAIETAHGFLTIIILVFTLLVSPLLLKVLKATNLYTFFFQSWATERLLTIIDAILFLSLIFISYGVLHFLLKNKWINRITAYSSLSKYQFWRRYKAPK